VSVSAPKMIGRRCRPHPLPRLPARVSGGLLMQAAGLTSKLSSEAGAAVGGLGGARVARGRSPPPGSLHYPQASADLTRPGTSATRYVRNPFITGSGCRVAPRGHSIASGAGSFRQRRKARALAKPCAVCRGRHRRRGPSSALSAGEARGCDRR
jgi:hypothetical protein